MKNKLFIIVLIILVSIAVTACGDTNAEPSDKKQNQSSETSDSTKPESTSLEGNFKGYSFVYDSTWRTRKSDDEKFMYLYPTDKDSDGFVMLSYTETEVTSESAATLLFAENMTNNDTITEVKENSETALRGNYARKVLFNQLIEETEYEIESYIIPSSNNGIMFIGYCVPPSNIDKYYDGFFEILHTLEETDSGASMDTNKTPSVSQETLATKLGATEAWGAVLSYGKSQYPHGFKLDLVLGRIAEEALDEDTWFLKSSCEVTNEYGATAEMTCEAKVTGTTDSPEVTGFDVY